MSAKIILIIFICKFCSLLSFADNRSEQLPLFTADIFYGNDTTSYDDTTQTVIRSKNQLKLDKHSIISSSHIFKTVNSSHTMSNGILYSSSQLPIQLLAGNYFINYGCGLLIGKKNYNSSDIFSYSGFSSMADIHSRNTSGNPIFSFSGLSIILGNNDNTKGLHLHLFYSIRDRFTDIKNGRYTTSSLHTVASKTDRGNRHLVRLTDRGSMLQYKGLFFTMQLYHSDSRLFDDSSTSIGWSYNAVSESAQHKQSMTGMYISYKDPYVYANIEYGLSNILHITASELKNKFAFLSNCGFTHKVIQFRFAHRQYADYFYTPYSTFSNSLKNADQYMLTLKMSKIFNISAIIYSETTISGSQLSHFRSANHEKILTKLSPLNNIFINVEYNSVKSYAMSGNSVNRKLKYAINYKRQNKKTIQLQGTLQGNRMGRASLHSFFFNYSLFGLIIQSRYAYIQSDHSNRIYIAPALLFANSMAGFHLTANTHITAVCAKLKTSTLNTACCYSTLLQKNRQQQRLTTSIKIRI